MFSSSGYFKGIHCPYYSSGLCERPYCHFGHFASSANTDRGTHEDDGLPAASTSSTFQKLDKVKWYNPTPIPKLKSRAFKHKRYTAASSAPAYNPTPIHLLKTSPEKPEDEGYVPVQIPLNKQSHRVKAVPRMAEYVPLPVQKPAFGGVTTPQKEYVPTPVVKPSLDGVTTLQTEYVPTPVEKPPLDGVSTRQNEYVPTPVQKSHLDGLSTPQTEYVPTPVPKPFDGVSTPQNENVPTPVEKPPLDGVSTSQTEYVPTPVQKPLDVVSTQQNKQNNAAVTRPPQEYTPTAANNTSVEHEYIPTPIVDKANSINKPDQSNKQDQSNKYIPTSIVHSSEVNNPHQSSIKPEPANKTVTATTPQNSEDLNTTNDSETSNLYIDVVEDQESSVDCIVKVEQGQSSYSGTSGENLTVEDAMENVKKTNKDVKIDMSKMKDKFRNMTNGMCKSGDKKTEAKLVENEGISLDKIKALDQDFITIESTDSDSGRKSGDEIRQNSDNHEILGDDRDKIITVIDDQLDDILSGKQTTDDENIAGLKDNTLDSLDELDRTIIEIEDENTPTRTGSVKTDEPIVLTDDEKGSDKDLKDKSKTTQAISEGNTAEGAVHKCSCDHSAEGVKQKTHKHKKHKHSSSKHKKSKKKSSSRKKKKQKKKSGDSKKRHRHSGSEAASSSDTSDSESEATPEKKEGDRSRHKHSTGSSGDRRKSVEVRRGSDKSRDRKEEGKASSADRHRKEEKTSSHKKHSKVKKSRHRSASSSTSRSRSRSRKSSIATPARSKAKKRSRSQSSRHKTGGETSGEKKPGKRRRHSRSSDTHTSSGSSSSSDSSERKKHRSKRSKHSDDTEEKKKEKHSSGPKKEGSTVSTASALRSEGIGDRKRRNSSTSQVRVKVEKVEGSSLPPKLNETATVMIKKEKEVQKKPDSSPAVITVKKEKPDSLSTQNTPVEKSSPKPAPVPANIFDSMLVVNKVVNHKSGTNSKDRLLVVNKVIKQEPGTQSKDGLKTDSRTDRSKHTSGDIMNSIKKEPGTASKPKREEVSSKSDRLLSSKGKERRTLVGDNRGTPSQRDKEKRTSVGDNRGTPGHKHSVSIKKEKVESHSSTKASSKKPAYVKCRSSVALFGEDSDSDPDTPVPLPVATNGRNRHAIAPAPVVVPGDSDSDSIVLSSDAESITRAPFSALAKRGSVSSDGGCPTLDLDDVDLQPEADPFDECLQIFNEEQPSTSKSPESSMEETEDPSVRSFTGFMTSFIEKKREARPHATIKSGTQQRIESQRRGLSRPSAQKALHSRMTAMQNATQGSPEREKTLLERKSLLLGDPFAAKSRVAHAPPPPPRRKAEKRAKNTDSGTPKKKVARRPILPPDFSSKVPTSVRQQYLNKMIDDCLKLYPEEQEAYDRALAEEKVVHDRSNNKSIYVRVFVNAIKKLRDEATALQAQGGSRKSVSHYAVLGGAKAAATHFTLNRTGKSPHKFSVEIFVAHLEESYLLTDPQLEENSFPRPDPERSGQTLIKVDGKVKPQPTIHKHERQCVRCEKTFQINPNTGEYVRVEQCVYHWGKSWKTRVARSWENKWTCCGGDLATKGCQIGNGHVHEHNRWNVLSGYVQTLPGSALPEPQCRAYALDCEMIYTTHGSELARITVVDFNCEVILEKLVRPSHRIIDYNTRFSGITEKDLRSVRTTIRDIQAILLSLFTDRTILIGHSLESDLIALKMMHCTVVDTSLVFPHKLGLPYKRGLKTLMGEILQKIIQEDVGGHNSLEDAASAMELMIWKVKDDLKHKKVKV